MSDDYKTLSFWFNVIDKDCKTEFDLGVGIAIYVLVILSAFYSIAKICDEFLMVSLERMSNALELSTDVAGATFLAFASSAPEIFYSLAATFVLVSAGGTGCIAGSALFSLLVIIGSSILVSPKKCLAVARTSTLRDVSWNFIGMCELLLVLLDDQVDWYEALLLVFTYIIALVSLAKNPCARTRQTGDKNACGEEQENTQIVEYARTGVCPSGDDGTPKKDSNRKNASTYKRENGESSEDRVWTSATQDEKLENDEDKRRHLVVDPMETTSIQVSMEEVALEINTRRNDGDRDGDLENNDDDDREKNLVGQLRDNNSAVPEQPSAGKLCRMDSSGHASIESEGKLTIQLSSGSLRSILEDKSLTRRQRWIKRSKQPCASIMSLMMPPDDKYFRVFIVCIAWLTVFTFLIVDSSHRLGCVLEVPPVVFGLIFISAGASIPDAINSITASRRGYGDMATSNALGSTLINITIGLGLPWLIRCAYSKEPIIIEAGPNLKISMYIYLASLLLYVLLAYFANWRLHWPCGVFMLCTFASYFLYILLSTVL